MQHQHTLRTLVLVRKHALEGDWFKVRDHAVFLLSTEAWFTATTVEEEEDIDNKDEDEDKHNGQNKDMGQNKDRDKHNGIGSSAIDIDIDIDGPVAEDPVAVAMSMSPASALRMSQSSYAIGGPMHLYTGQDHKDHKEKDINESMLRPPRLVIQELALAYEHASFKICHHLLRTSVCNHSLSLATKMSSSQLGEDNSVYGVGTPIVDYLHMDYSYLNTIPLQTALQMSTELHEMATKATNVYAPSSVCDSGR